MVQRIFWLKLVQLKAESDCEHCGALWVFQYHGLKTMLYFVLLTEIKPHDSKYTLQVLFQSCAKTHRTKKMSKIVINVL